MSLEKDSRFSYMWGGGEIGRHARFKILFPMEVPVRFRLAPPSKKAKNSKSRYRKIAAFFMGLIYC